MRTRMLRPLSLATALMLLCGGAAATTPHAPLAPAAEVACGPAWGTVPSPPELKDPRAIAPIAADDIWLIGSRAERGSQVATGAAHWNGDRWRLVPTPDRTPGGYAENALNGVDAVGPDFVWAVGYSLTKGTHQTLVARWDGDEWRLVDSPNVGDEGSSLTGVVALRPNLAWAVGFSREGPRRKTLVLRWDGEAWATVPSPNPGALSNVLLDVAAVAADDVWAVGYQNGREGHRPLALHYDGREWREAAVPALGAGDNVLTSISAGTGDDVWAAGYYVEGTQHKALTARYDGTGWAAVAGANPGDGTTILRDIDAGGPGQAWAVGFEYRASRNAFVASTQRWDGAAWTAEPSAIAQSPESSEMLAVGRAPGATQVWAAGQPANVETVCPAETGGEVASPAAATEAPAADSAEPTAGTGAPPEASRAGGGEATPASGARPVRAVDKAEEAGIRESTRTYGAVVADFDSDRDPDIFLGRHGDAPRLYINDGRRHFTETNKGRFGRLDRHGCDAADVNRDGRKDIYCTVGAVHGAGTKLNQLFVQQPDGTFVDRIAEYGAVEPFARGRSAVFVDANGDTLPDLFVMNESERADGLPSPNRLLVNQGGSAFRYAPEYGLELEADGGHATVGDFDRDGWQDLLVAAQPHSRAVFALDLYRNGGGNGYTNVAGSVGLGHRVVDAIFADLNGDAWPDVVEVTSDELRVLLNERGTFSPAFATSLSAGLAVAAGDVNGDRRPDLYVLRGKGDREANAPDLVYLNDGTGAGFTRMPSIPSTDAGEAESVWPLDYDGNGLTDFLVLNGLGTRDNLGPVQLIAFFPDTDRASAGAEPADGTVDGGSTP